MSNSENLSLHLMEMRNKYKQCVDECYENTRSRKSAYARKEAHNYMWLYQGKVDTLDTLIQNLDSGLYNQPTESFISNFLNK